MGTDINEYKKIYRDETKGITVAKITLSVDDFLNLATDWLIDCCLSGHRHNRRYYIVRGVLEEAFFRHYKNSVLFSHEPFIDPGDGIITFTGKSVCGPDDVYDPVFGKKLALSRAEAKLHKALAKTYTEAKVIFKTYAEAGRRMAGDELIRIHREKVS